MFADIPEKTTFEKKQYAVIQDGKPFLFQLIDEKATQFRVHTIKTSDGRWVKVPHNSDSTILNEDWFNKNYPGTWKYQVNILDVTPYIVNERSGSKFSVLNARAPERDPVNGDDLRNLPKSPLNEVKILEGGVTLFSQINSLIGTLMAENPKLDLHTIVFQLQASGAGKTKVVTVFPRMDVQAQDLSTYAGYELTLTEFSDEEISKMLKGTSLRDIFTARKNESSEEDSGSLDFSGGLPGLI
jgi:hypothetical protein